MAAQKPAKKSPAQAGALPDELADTWSVWLSLRWDFDLRNWDATVAQLPPGIGSRKTLQRHRDGLLTALEDRDDASIADKLELMVRTLSMALAKPLATAGQALRLGGKKGASASREARRGNGSKRVAILAAAREYSGPEDARTATIARRTQATEQYVRRVLAEIRN